MKSPEYNDETFWELVASDRTSLLAFWSHTCAPCKVMAPVFERVGKEFRGRIEFVAVNTYDRPDIAGRFGVSSTPTLILVRNNKALRHFYGVIPEARLKENLLPYAPPPDPNLEEEESRGIFAGIRRIFSNS